MARPPKQVVDYFPHDSDASEGRTLSILFNNFGHDGISCWWQLLERISRTNNHVITLRNGEDIEYLAAKLHFKTDQLIGILDKMAALDAIDADLWKHRVIWSDNFVARLKDVYSNRRQDLPAKPIVPTDTNAVSATDNPISNPRNTTKETKLKETKLKEIIIPDFIDKKTWEAFLEMRKEKKALPTGRGQELLIKKLQELKAAGDDPNEVINQSIMNNWTGVFALKREGVKNGKYQGNPSQKPAGAFANLEREV